VEFPHSVSPGDPIPRDAETWNALLAAAHDFRTPARPKDQPKGLDFGGVVEAFALNSTGAALSPNKPATVTAAGGLDVTADGGPPWQRKPLLTLGVPGAATDFVVVTLDAIPAGEIGRVAVAGTVLCDVHVNSSGHAYASPTTNTTALESAATGSIRLLHKGTGSSTRRCVVYLGDQVAAAAGSALATKNADLTAVDTTTTTIITDQATGLQTAGTAGTSTFSLRAATTAQVGAVTITTQSFAGNKTFTGNVVVNGTHEVKLASGNSHVGSQADSLGGGYSYATVGVGSFPGAGAGVTVYSAFADATGTGCAYVSIGNSTSGNNMVVGINPTNARRGINFSGSAPLAASDVTWQLYTEATVASLMCTLDFEFADIGDGPIVRSPNGNRWRLGVSNAGALTITGPI
jgi:hypothetical protein